MAATAKQDVQDLADIAEVFARLRSVFDGTLLDRQALEELAGLAERHFRHHLELIHQSVTKTAAAEFLGVTDETITAWVRRGVLRAGGDPTTPKETVDVLALLDVWQRIHRFEERGVTDKAVWAKLLAAGLGENGEPFSDEDLAIIDLNRSSRGRGLLLPHLDAEADHR